MPHYASKTSVPSDRSMSEIEQTLRRYGASKFMYGRDDARVMIAFEMRDRRIRCGTALPHICSRAAQTSEPCRRCLDTKTLRQRWFILTFSIGADW